MLGTQLALAGLSYLPGGGLLISGVNTAATTTSVLKSAWTGGRTSTATKRKSRPTSSLFTRSLSPSLAYDHHAALEADSSSSSPPCTPPSSATSPPLRPLMLSTLRHQQQQQRTPMQYHHGHGHGQRGGSTDMMMLGTTCHGCGSHVAVQVPPWMLNAIESNQHPHYAPAWRGAGGDEVEYPPPVGARAARTLEGGRPYAQRTSKVDWRETVVHTAIGTAHAIKASPIPGLLLTFFRAAFAFLLLLDARFSLHQRAAIILSRFLEGLVEIEKEVGVMRGAGEALSIGWEATVRGIIAFAKSDSSSSTSTNSQATYTYEQPRKSSQPTTSIFTRQQPQQPLAPSATTATTHHDLREQSTSYFPPYHDPHARAHHPHAYPMTATAESAQTFFEEGGEADHLSSGSPPRVGVDLDYSHETSCPPSPPPILGQPSAAGLPRSMSSGGGGLEFAHPRPLRRTPMSSPALQSAYLAQQSRNHPMPPLPTSASTHFVPSSSSSTSTTSISASSSSIGMSATNYLPFLPSSSSASSEAETLLPPYDLAASAATVTATSGGGRSKAYPRHSAGATVPDGFSHSTVASVNPESNLHLRRQRSRSGPGQAQAQPYLDPLGIGGGAALVPAPPPPSPVGSRAGWAGKAMLGLAERMKVI
ncbi:hypothetical protein JCM10908_002654 [Rhodotorula pacifica]|uniref:uncharacterized protein n=1 Tax=Rhodotorula pacifica TaxID=1495444 RepID=UPI00316B45C6